jgi:hypothetical protein
MKDYTVMVIFHGGLNRGRHPEYTGIWKNTGDDWGANPSIVDCLSNKSIRQDFPHSGATAVGVYRAREVAKTTIEKL